MPTNYFLLHYKHLYDLGYHSIIPLRGKRPTIANWQKITDIGKHPDILFSSSNPNAELNIGLVTTDYFVFDFDYSTEKLALTRIKQIQLALGPGLVRDGASNHYQLLYYTNKAIQSFKVEDPLSPPGATNICNIRSKGSQSLVLGVHPDTKRKIEWLNSRSILTIPRNEILANIFDIQNHIYKLDFVKKERAVFEPSVASRSTGQSNNIPCGLNEYEIREMLEKIGAESLSDYSEWLKVLMALHHETEGSDFGLQLAIEHSRKWPKFGSDKEVKQKWQSFSNFTEGPKVTFRSILKKVGNQPPMVEVVNSSNTDSNQSKIDGTNLRRRHSTDGRATDYFRLSTFAKLYIDDLVMKGAPRDLVHYIPLMDRTECLNILTGDFSTKESMLDKFESLLKATKTKRNLYELFKIYGIYPITDCMYDPGSKLFFTYRGGWYFNTYAAPIIERHIEFEEEAKRYLQTIKSHISTLYSGDSEATELFFSWLIWQIKSPGKKVNWGPLLCGPPGCGKSFFLRLLQLVLGHENVGALSLKELATDFTDGLHEKVLIGIEELMGLEFRGAYETLKSLITETNRAHTPKGKRLRYVKNTINFIFCTNKESQLSALSDDRRFLILISKYKTKEKFKAWMDDYRIKTGEYYFDALHAPIDKYSKDTEKLECFTQTLRWVMKQEQLCTMFDAHKPCYETKDNKILKELNYENIELASLEAILSSESGEWAKLTCTSQIRSVFDPKSCRRIDNLIKSPLEKLGYSYLGSRFRITPTKNEMLWIHDTFKTLLESRPLLERESLLQRAKDELKAKHQAQINSTLFNY